MRQKWLSTTGNCRLCAANDSERATFEAFWPRFGAVMRRLNLDFLGSESRCVSWFIAGPSNFPSRQMEKRNRWAHNKLNHMFDVKARMLKRIKKDLRPELRPIMAGDDNATERLSAKIAQAERLQAVMKDCNAAIRSNRKAGEAAQVAALVAIFTAAGWVAKDPESRARELLKPDFCGRIGFADFELTNNNANIRRMKERLASISRNQNAASAEIEGAKARYEDCPAENRVRLFFPGKPAEDVRSRLKASGFRWSPTLGCWQAYRNDRSDATARAEAGL
jgi:hypothetical protein